MHIATKKFDELSRSQLYEILQLRSEIFVVEQNCTYQDLDGKDQEALHVLGTKNNKIVAYARCFAPGLYFEEAAIGRILVKAAERKFGLGHQIVEASINALEEKFRPKTIQLSAQQYLIAFYETHGFETMGEGYLEDGIPHIAMVRKR